MLEVFRSDKRMLVIFNVTSTILSVQRFFDINICNKYSKTKWSLVFFLSLLVLVACRPQEFDYEEEGKHSGNGKDEVGRVQIKVYRGPTKHDGYAPWGFWVKQPSDEENN